MSTTKELIRAHNELAAERGLPPLQGWKAGKDQLQARIDGMTAVAPADPLAIPEDAQDDPRAFGVAEPDTVSPNGAEEATGDHDRDTEHPVVITVDRFVPVSMIGLDDEVVDVNRFVSTIQPKGVGRMVEELLLDPEAYDYGFIVEAVRREFPHARTSRRSVASVAARLRRDGAAVPMRTRRRDP